MGLIPKTPQKEAGPLTEPPVSVPMAISTTPVAVAIALPPEDPPATLAGSWGFNIGPSILVVERGDAASSSKVVFAVIVAPEDNNRVTKVASEVGTKFEKISEPALIGMPATEMASLTPTVRLERIPWQEGGTIHDTEMAL